MSDEELFDYESPALPAETEGEALVKKIEDLFGYVPPDSLDKTEGEALVDKLNSYIAKESVVRCPYQAEGHSAWCALVPKKLFDVIMHLNDRHLWSREKIADWLEATGNNPEFPVPRVVPKEPGEE